MPDAIPHAVRRSRAHELEALGLRNRTAFAESFVGKTVSVCIEKDGNGWTDEYLRFAAPPGGTRRKLAEFRVRTIRQDGSLR